MGMVLQLRRADPAAIEALRQREGAIEEFIFGEDIELDAGNELIDLDESWHAIHFLLSGNAWDAPLPAGTLVAGEPVGDDLGYGPPRLLGTQAVAAFSKFLDSKPADFIEKTFDFDALKNADIYPDMWDRRDPGDIEYVSSFFEPLRVFFRAAAANGEAVVVALT